MSIQINWSHLKFSLSRTDSLVVPNTPIPVYPRWMKLIVPFMIALSIGAWWFYYSQDLVLSYNDARSHLNVARRVVDNLNPGIVQIGTVWLPLFHLLEIITIWNDSMFRTGLSGSIISMLSFIGSGTILVKLVRLLGLDHWAAIAALSVFALNQNMLFMQSLPMTESLLLFTSLGAVYFFTRWVRTYTLPSLLLSGIMTFLSMMTRYDGWFLFIAISVAIVILSLVTLNRKKAESNFIIYSTLGLFAVILWVGWNGIIFGDPLYFINGTYSAKAQQDVLFSEGRLLTKHNLGFSAWTYLLAVKENIGLVLSALGSLGLIAALLSKIRLSLKLAILLLIVPVVFNIISLYLGQSVIHLPFLPPYTWFNDRYGLLTLPAIAVGVAILVNKRWFAAILICLVVILQSYTMYATNNIITVQDGVRGASGYFLDDIGRWMNDHAASGKILVAASSHDAMIFISGLPLKNFITEGTGKYWDESLMDPTKHADFIIMHEGDLVYKAIAEIPSFKDNYSLVYKGQFSDVYQKNTQ